MTYFHVCPWSNEGVSHTHPLLHTSTILKRECPSISCYCILLLCVQTWFSWHGSWHLLFFRGMKTFPNMCLFCLLAEICDGCFLFPSEVVHLWSTQRDWATGCHVRFPKHSCMSFTCWSASKQNLCYRLGCTSEPEISIHYRKKNVCIKSKSVDSCICYFSPPAPPSTPPPCTDRLMRTFASLSCFPFSWHQKDTNFSVL